MILSILITVVTTSLIWFAILYLNQRKHHSDIQLIEANNSNKIEELLITFNKEIINQYNKGFTDSEQKRNFTIQITPFKEICETESFFKSKKSIKLGYKQAIVSNGITNYLAEPIIVENISIEKLNEENVKLAISVLNKAIDAVIIASNPTPVIINGSTNELNASILKLFKKRNNLLKKLNIFSSKKSNQ
ncbi:MAG: hypothetical protein HXX16_20735 [Bacteroidales bacterium]|nr:hypothetical protein [Bacteroidales bacterium]